MSAQGMTLTVLVTQLVQAYAADTAPEGEGCDIAAGLIGPNVSDWLRDVAGVIAAPVATAEPTEGWVLVPKRMTQEMRDVTDSEGWTWEDLLAEAGSISQEEYAAIAAAPVAPVGDKPATSEPA